jgi:hypothetical protein
MAVASAVTAVPEAFVAAARVYAGVNVDVGATGVTALMTAAMRTSKSG